MVVSKSHPGCCTQNGGCGKKHGQNYSIHVLKGKVKMTRLDIELVNRQICETRSKAQMEIKNSNILVNGKQLQSRPLMQKVQTLLL